MSSILTEQYFLQIIIIILFIYFFGLNKLSYINKMLTFAQLKEILKENQIKGYSHYHKLKLIDLLHKRGLIPEKYETNKQVKAKKDSKYNFLRERHSHPKKVEIHDLKTEKIDLILLYTRLLWISINIWK